MLSPKAKIHNLYRPLCPIMEPQPCQLDCTTFHLKTLFVWIWSGGNTQSTDQNPSHGHSIGTWNRKKQQDTTWKRHTWTIGFFRSAHQHPKRQGAQQLRWQILWMWMPRLHRWWNREHFIRSSCNCVSKENSSIYGKTYYIRNIR